MSPEPVGSLAEEAAKLVSALSSMQPSGHGDPENPHDPLAPECRYCPFCALVRAARSMTPEVREHLASAATSMLLAARGFLDEAMAKSADVQGEDAEREQPVEKIDLAED
jgi:hypothetical protein